MHIILKFILKNIREKKFRTFLILFSIIISSALFFTSNAVSTTSMKMLEDRMRQRTGNAEIMIQASNDSPSPFFGIGQIRRLSQKVDYVIGAVESTASYQYSKDESVTISLLGIEIKDLNLINPVKFYDEGTLEPFSGMKVIISKSTAEKYGVTIGDTLKLEINGSIQRFRICSLSYSTGLFTENGMTVTAVVPREVLSSIYNAKGDVNVAYIKPKFEGDKDEIINWLSDTYKRYIVKEPFTHAEIQQQLGPTSVMFMLMTVIVAFISIFIIYSSFKVITIERLPVIGTFRSIGATKKITNFVLLLESITYGVIGGLFGCGLGIGMLYGMTYFTTPAWERIDGVKVYYTSGQLVQAFVLAVVLCFISSIIPIIKISRLPLKEIIFNTNQLKHSNRSWKRIIIGTLFIATALLGPYLLYKGLAPKQISILADVACMILSIAGIIMLIPFLTSGFVKVFEKVYEFIFGNIGVLAAKNLRENKSLLSNISLLSIGIASLLMINSISYSVSTVMTSLYSTAHSDIIMMNAKDSNRNFEGLLKSVDGVDGVYMCYRFNGIELAGRNDQIGLIESVDNSELLDYWDMDINGDRKKVLEEFDAGRNILITNTLRTKYNVGIGDTLTLKMTKGDREYRVSGFFNSMMLAGNYALIPERFLKQDMETNNANMIYIKSFKDPEDVAKELRKEFAIRKPEIFTLKGMETTERDSFAKLLNILKGFSLITLLIGILGVLNNLLISFIERKRSLAMFRSVGMSRKQIVSMIFLESFSGGIVAGIVGVMTGLLLVSIVPYILKAMDQTIPVSSSPDLILVSVVGAMIIMMSASISPALRSSKLNIIESIKYE